MKKLENRLLQEIVKEFNLKLSTRESLVIEKLKCNRLDKVIQHSVITAVVNVRNKHYNDCVSEDEVISIYENDLRIGVISTSKTTMMRLSIWLQGDAEAIKVANWALSKKVRKRDFKVKINDYFEY